MKKENEKLKTDIKNLTSKEEASEATVSVNNKNVAKMNIKYRGKPKRRIKFFQANS